MGGASGGEELLAELGNEKLTVPEGNGTVAGIFLDGTPPDDVGTGLLDVGEDLQLGTLFDDFQGLERFDDSGAVVADGAVSRDDDIMLSASS